MKTAREFVEGKYWSTIDQVVVGMEKRDAEWRRLVDEAQATSTGLADVLKETQAMNIEMRVERDRIKGELAEMADELAEAADIIDDAMEHCGDIDQKRAHKFLAATPAEQAQQPQGVNPSPPFMRDDQGRSRAAEQAQGEGAPHVTCETVPKGEWCFGCGEALTPSNRHTGPACIIETSIAALAKRVDAIAKGMDMHSSCIGELSAWAKMRDKRPFTENTGRAAPPPPEAAGPGHAFVCRESKQGKHTEGPCSDICPCTCDLPRAALVHYSTSGLIVAKLPCGHVPHRGSDTYCNDPTGLCSFAAFGPRRTVPKEEAPEAVGHTFVPCQCDHVNCCAVDGCYADRRDHAVPPIPEGK